MIIPFLKFQTDSSLLVKGIASFLSGSLAEASTWMNRFVDAGGATLFPALTQELGVDVARAATALLQAEDVLRAPTFDDFRTRPWRVVDQALPVPFPIGSTDLQDPAWIPMHDSLSDSFATIRRFSAFRAYHDDGISEVIVPEELQTDSRLIGRSVWNTRWLLIVPGAFMLADPDAGLDGFIDSVTDIRVFFETYGYSGN